MATPYRIRAVEQAHNVPIAQLIPDLVNRLGSQKAAAERRGLSQATISTWLRENGYTPRVIYVKGDDPDAGSEGNDSSVYPAQNL